MPIITVASGKGGCGKTTSVLAIAGALKKLGARPDAVLDLDYGASLTRAYGYQPSSPFAQALLDGRASFEDALHETAEGVPLIPTTAELGAVEKQKMPIWRDRLRELGQERLLVVDTSDDILSTPVAAAILAADVLAIPVQLNKKAYDRTFPEIAGLLDAQNHHPEQVWFGTIVDRRPALFRHLMKTIADDGIELVGLVPQAVAINEADFKAMSVIGSDPNSKPAQAYVEIATAIYARLRRISGVRPAQGGRQPRTLPELSTVNG